MTNSEVKSIEKFIERIKTSHESDIIDIERRKWFAGELRNLFAQVEIRNENSIEEIQQMYDMLFNGFKNQEDAYVLLCDLLVAVNHQSWYWYNNNDVLGRKYSDLYYSVRNYILDTYEEDKEALQYYFEYTD